MSLDSQNVVAPDTQTTGATVVTNADAEMQAFTPPVVNNSSNNKTVKQMFTEVITGYKLVKRSTDNSEVYLITTNSNKEIWAPKSQFDTNSETVTFTPVKKGQQWHNPKTGQSGVYQADAYQFATCGKRDTVDTKTAVLANLFKAGFTPTISI